MFWELTNKKRYHLPARWGYRETRLKMAEAEADALPAVSLACCKRRRTLPVHSFTIFLSANAKKNVLCYY